MTTYVMKLGVDQLVPPYDSPIDRQVAASSEGALFEYGGDDAIVGNLEALRAAGAGAQLVAGSVTRNDAMRRRMIEETRIRLIPRGLAGFAPLAARAGFAIAEVEPAWLSDQVLLRPC
jgi:hypothetical protein